MTWPLKILGVLWQLRIGKGCSYHDVMVMMMMIVIVIVYYYPWVL